jgi:hypothetical protein
VRDLLGQTIELGLNTLPGEDFSLVAVSGHDVLQSVGWRYYSSDPPRLAITACSCARSQRLRAMPPP